MATPFTRENRGAPFKPSSPSGGGSEPARAAAQAGLDIRQAPPPPQGGVPPPLAAAPPPGIAPPQGIAPVPTGGGVDQAAQTFMAAIVEAGPTPETREVVTQFLLFLKSFLEQVTGTAPGAAPAPEGAPFPPAPGQGPAFPPPGGGIVPSPGGAPPPGGAF